MSFKARNRQEGVAEKLVTDSKELVIKGIAAAPGIAIGKILKITSDNTTLVAPPAVDITEEELPAEIERLNDALDRTRDSIYELQARLANEINAAEAQIFDAHLMIVDDRMIYDEVVAMATKKLKCVEHCFYTVTERYSSAIAAMPDPYIQERAVDIRDVSGRVLRNLCDAATMEVDISAEDRYIILAQDLTPSDTATLDRDKVLGFATASGSKTSHSAVLARSMQLPALVGMGNDVLEQVSSGDEVVIDGYSGQLILSPSSETLAKYRQKYEEMQRFNAVLAQESKLRPETLDGFMVQLSANIESLNDIPAVKASGSCGVGLFRSEYMFLTRKTPPTEEEQFNIYRSLLTELGDEPLIIRTLDVGGDKLDSKLRRYAEDNPFLGLRGIRLSLRERTDIFKTQLRALLQASKYGKLRVMLPMISCIEEIIEVKQIIEELKRELKLEKKEFAEHLELGAMIETPAAALMVEHLAKVVDFFSIGTNDLIQYTMAIDRGNERVAYLYQPGHPVILDLIHRTAQVARRHNIYVSVCGQAAGDPRLALLFAGLGVHELSMVPANIGAIRRVIRQVSMHEAEQLGMQALQCATSAEVIELASGVLSKIAPEVYARLEKI